MCAKRFGLVLNMLVALCGCICHTISCCGETGFHTGYCVSHLTVSASEIHSVCNNYSHALNTHTQRLLISHVHEVLNHRFPFNLNTVFLQKH